VFGLTLAALLLWCAAPLRKQFRMSSTLLVVPAALASALVFYLWPQYRFDATAFLTAEAVLVAAFDPATKVLGRRPGSVSWTTSSPYIAAGALVVWLAFRNLSFGTSRIDVVLAMLAVLGVIVSLYWADRAGRLNAAVFVWFASLFLAIGLAIGGLTGQEWSACSAQFDKCSVAGRLYTGIFGSENVLGVIAFLCLLLIVQIPRYQRKPLHIATFAVLLLVAGSRTPLAAFAIYLVIGGLLAWTARPRRDHGWAARPGVLVALVAGITFVGVRLAYTAGANSFSNRGRRWAEIVSDVHATSLMGRSQAEYKYLLDRGSFFGHYPHSQYIALLYFGGIVALGLYSLMMYLCCARVTADSRQALAIRLAPMVCVLIYGLLEMAWNAATIDPTTWTLIAVLAASASGSLTVRDEPAADPDPATARPRSLAGRRS
jgi:hypothetical protein